MEKEFCASVVAAVAVEITRGMTVVAEAKKNKGKPVGLRSKIEVRNLL